MVNAVGRFKKMLTAIQSPKRPSLGPIKLSKKQLLKSPPFSRTQLLIFGIVFAAIGSYAVYQGFAVETCPTLMTDTPVPGYCTGSIITVTPASFTNGTIGPGGVSVSPGDVVIFEDGSYTDANSDGRVMNITGSGTASQWITLVSRNKWGAKMWGQNNAAAEGIGFSSSGRYVRVEGFEVHEVGNVGSPRGSASGIDLYNGGKNSQIVGNHIHHVGNVCANPGNDNGEVGIYIQSGKSGGDIIVENNYVHDVGRLDGQGCFFTRSLDHGMYLNGGSGGGGGASNVMIRNNIFHDFHRGWGIQFYPASVDNINILNNSFAFCNQDKNYTCMVMDAPITNTNIKNNIYYNPQGGKTIENGGGTWSNVVLANNITSGNAMFDTPPGGGTTQTNNQLSTNALLVNPPTDFRLQSTSPAINAGLTLSNVTIDFEGTTRPQGAGYEIGAYEYMPGGADTQPPTVSMTAPANGASVRGSTVTVSANASDNVGVAGVQFKLDGADLGAEDTSSPYSISWNSTTASNGSHTLTAVARDAAGNTATATSVTVTVDNSAPAVSMTAPPDGATVSGSTVVVSATASDNVAVAGVQFKLDGNNLNAEDTTSPYTINWNSTTTTNGAHTLTAVARDAAGNTTTSAAITVTVDNDITPPTVSITAPAGGSTVSGSSVTVSANASDNVAVAGVQFKLDGANLNAEDTSSPYSISWNSTTASNGSHSLTAVARDAAGNSTTSSTVTVTVDNSAPSVSVTAPSNGSSVRGSSVSISATASDNVAVAGVQFKLDGANLNSEDTTSPYSIAWDTTTTTNGSHTLTAVARDAAGNTTTSSTITVTVDNSAPTVSITAPSNGASIGGTNVVVSATASDNIAVVGVQFKLDGANLNSEDTTSPYSITWNSTTASNGSHTLTAVARDAAGNTTTSSSVTVTVDNSAPTASITAPAAGSSVRGSAVTVSANASDNVGVVGVQFKLDGSNLGGEDTTSPYSISWDSTTATNGSHTLTAVARDAAGNTTTSSAATVTVDNSAPTVSMTAPANGATVSGSSVVVSASASDNVAVAGVQFKMDGFDQGAEDTSNPYSIVWDTTTLGDGNHTLTAVARDAAGNTTTAATITVIVNNTNPPPPETIPPSVPTGLHSPPDNPPTTTTIFLAWNPSTDTGGSGLAGYKLYRNGNYLTDVVTGLTYTDSGLTPGTSYSYQVSAFDNAGNESARSSAITVSTEANPPPPPPPPQVRPGDCNNTGRVDLTDLSILLSNYSAHTTTCDFNGDSTISITDLSILLSHYGE